MINYIVLILIGVAIGSLGFLLLMALGGMAKLDGVGRQTLVLLGKRVKELEAENAALKAKLKPIETVDEWGKPDWVGKETRK